MKTPTDSKGFPPGVAEKLVVKAFRRQMESFKSGTVTDSPSTALFEASPNVSLSSRSDHGSVSTWNGGKTSKYAWSQTLSELIIDIRLGARVAKKSDVKVDFTPTKLKVVVSGETVVGGEFHSRVDPSESTWVIEDMERIMLIFEKSQESWWPRVLLGDEEIDTSKIESTKRIEEYDEETQGAIRKIMYDEQRKRQGLPTSDEEKMAEKLKAAWDVEGSPFKGTPFDPTVARGFMN
jgi:hypothetical protein